MKEVITFLAMIVNDIHDLLIIAFEKMGIDLTDKDLHFWIIGGIGIISFFIVHAIFKWVATWSLTTISFIYTFTVLVVLVFAIEIQQKITNRGNMEFADAVIGLWGFIALFAVYLFIKFCILAIRKIVERIKEEHYSEHSNRTRYRRRQM